MLRFGTDDLIKDIAKVVVDTDLGVDRAGEYWIHESLAEQYLSKVTVAIERLLRERLGLTKPEAEAKKPGTGTDPAK